MERGALPDQYLEVGIGPANCPMTTDSGEIREEGCYPNPVCGRLLVRQGSRGRDALLACPVRCRRTRRGRGYWNRASLRQRQSPGPC